MFVIKVIYIEPKIYVTKVIFASILIKLFFKTAIRFRIQELIFLNKFSFKTKPTA